MSSRPLPGTSPARSRRAEEQTDSIPANFDIDPTPGTPEAPRSIPTQR